MVQWWVDALHSLSSLMSCGRVHEENCVKLWRGKELKWDLKGAGAQKCCNSFHTTFWIYYSKWPKFFLFLFLYFLIIISVFIYLTCLFSVVLFSATLRSFLPLFLSFFSVFLCSSLFMTCLLCPPVHAGQCPVVQSRGVSGGAGEREADSQRNQSQTLAGLFAGLCVTFYFIFLSHGVFLSPVWCFLQIKSWLKDVV